MADLKRKGDLAELMVAADLARQGYRIAFPYGEDSTFDLLVERGDRWERVQVKFAASRNGALEVRARTHSLTNGRVMQTTLYTCEHIEWLAAWDSVTDQCFYVPTDELGTGMTMLTLRLTPARNQQRLRIRMADGYRTLPPLP
jgi:hypothetical protein